MRYQQWVRGVGLAVTVVVAGCATQQTEAPKPAPVVVAPPPAPVVRPPVAKAAPPKHVSSARTVDAYKKHVAERIAAANNGSLADKLPPILKSVVVLQISVDQDGNASNLSVFRSNGFKDLEQAAIASVRRAGKFDAPSDEVLGGQTHITYLETFLFRPDGRYQIRTIASASPSPAGAVAKKK